MRGNWSVGQQSCFLVSYSQDHINHLHVICLPHSFPLTADLERRGSSVAGGDAGGSTGSPVPFDLSSLSSSLPVRKTPESFLGPNAALVDLDSLLSSKPKPKQPPPPSISSTSHNPFLQTHGVYFKQSTFRDKSFFVYPSNINFTPLTLGPSSTGMGVAPGSTISSRGVSPTPPSASNPFGVTPMASISPQPSSLSLSQLRTSPIPQNPMLGHMPPPAVGMIQLGIGMPGMGVPMAAPGMGMGMVQSSPMGMSFGGISPMGSAGNPLLMGPGGPAQPALILGGPPGVGGVMGTGGSMGGGTTGTSTNPFLLWKISPIPRALSTKSNQSKTCPTNTNSLCLTKKKCVHLYI